MEHVNPRPLATVAIGMLGGIIVGITSVGSGSLMIVLLLFLYPTMGASQLVGTDLTQAVPLTLAAALGALAFGHVELSSPRHLSSAASRRVGRVAAFFERPGPLCASGDHLRDLRLGPQVRRVGTTAVGWILCSVLLAGGAAWFAITRPLARS